MYSRIPACSYLDISLDMEYSEKTQEEICHILLARIWGWNWGFVWILFIVKEQRLQNLHPECHSIFRIGLMWWWLISGMRPDYYKDYDG